MLMEMRGGLPSHPRQDDKDPEQPVDRRLVPLQDVLDAVSCSLLSKVLATSVISSGWESGRPHLDCISNNSRHFCLSVIRPLQKYSYNNTLKVSPLKTD